MTSLTDTVGATSKTTRYTYDPTSGRLDTITDPFTGTASTHYTYDAAGRVLTRSDPAGVTTSYGYDTAGRLTSKTSTTSTGVTVGSFAYTYDPASNVLTQSQSLLAVNRKANPENGTWAYTYDEQNRLKTAKLNTQPTISYEYDGAGNRTSTQVGTDPATSAHYDGANRQTTDGASWRVVPWSWSSQALGCLAWRFDYAYTNGIFDVSQAVPCPGEPTINPVPLGSRCRDSLADPGVRERCGLPNLGSLLAATRRCTRLRSRFANG